MIRVIYKNGDEDQISPKFLDILLFINEIEKFQRAGDWVSVSDGTLRKQSLSNYSGKERRRHSQSVLRSFAMENQPPAQRKNDSTSS